ncbi:unnamed protein product [Chrysoparadoxa australica]
MDLEFTCDCEGTGFGGPTCDIPDAECAAAGCQNAGLCTRTSTSDALVCDCSETGFTGDLCENPIDECIPFPCQNGGVCIDGINEFTCSCPEGTLGPTCAINLDECEDAPCQNGGTCTDGIGTFTCSCIDGFGGPTCSRESSTQGLEDRESGPNNRFNLTVFFVALGCSCVAAFVLLMWLWCRAKPKGEGTDKPVALPSPLKGQRQFVPGMLDDKQGPPPKAPARRGSLQTVMRRVSTRLSFITGRKSTDSDQPEPFAGSARRISPKPETPIKAFPEDPETP